MEGGELTLANGTTVTMTDGNWDSEVLESELPVLVDFFTDSCAPCRAMSPAIDAVALEYAAKAKVGKLNMIDYPATAMRYRISAVPTLMVFKGGEIIAQIVGALNQAQLRRLLDKHV